jgi:hypothetical protein
MTSQEEEVELFVASQETKEPMPDKVQSVHKTVTICTPDFERNLTELKLLLFVHPEWWSKQIQSLRDQWGQKTIPDVPVKREEKKSTRRKKKKAYHGTWKFVLPADTPLDPTKRCFQCGQWAKQDCLKCRWIHYCSAECAKQDQTPRLVYKELDKTFLPTHDELCVGMRACLAKVHETSHLRARPIFLMETLLASDNIHQNIVPYRHNRDSLERAASLSKVWVTELLSVTTVYAWLETHYAPCTVWFSCASPSPTKNPFRLVCVFLKPVPQDASTCPICKKKPVVQCSICTMRPTCESCIQHKTHIASCAPTFFTLKKAMQERVRLIDAGLEKVCPRDWLTGDFRTT